VLAQPQLQHRPTGSDVFVENHRQRYDLFSVEASVGAGRRKVAEGQVFEQATGHPARLKASPYRARDCRDVVRPRLRDPAHAEEDT
jgi:hypothetical protein